MYIYGGNKISDVDPTQLFLRVFSPLPQSSNMHAEQLLGGQKTQKVQPAASPEQLISGPTLLLSCFKEDSNPASLP